MNWHYVISVPGICHPTPPRRGAAHTCCQKGRLLYALPPEVQVHATLVPAATALGAMPADEQSGVEVASVLSKSGGAP